MTAPIGCLSLPQEYLREMLANCATWQEACNVSNAEQAAARIHRHGLPAPSNKQAYTRDESIGARPYAIIYTAEQNGLSRAHEATGDHFEFSLSGQLMLRIERNSPDNNNNEPTAPANCDFDDLIGSIINEMCALAGGAGYLAFGRLTLVSGPSVSHPDLAETQGVSQEVLLSIQYEA